MVFERVVVVVLTAVVVLLAIFFVGMAFGKDVAGNWQNAPPKVRTWLREQVVPGSNGAGKQLMFCCTEADGEEVQEKIEGGAYWIQGGSFKEWTKVPDGAVIEGPNPHGQPVVWSTGSTHAIRCYAPGAKI